MFRGIERQSAFRDDVDREAFLRGPAALAAAGPRLVYARALLPDHLGDV
jgi:hypothetical protein